jgi:hypothetical protein
VGDGDPVGEGVPLGEGDGDPVGDGVGEPVGDGDPMGDGEPPGKDVGGLGGDGDGDPVGDGDGDPVAEGVGDAVGDGDADVVADGEPAGEDVPDPVGDGDADVVADGEPAGEDVPDPVGDGDAAALTAAAVSACRACGLARAVVAIPVRSSGIPASTPNLAARRLGQAPAPGERKRCRRRCRRRRAAALGRETRAGGVDCGGVMVMGRAACRCGSPSATGRDRLP